MSCRLFCAPIMVVVVDCISRRAPSLRCSQCKTVFYCSPEHQKFHWKIHKTVCAAPNSSKNIMNSKNSNSTIDSGIANNSLSGRETTGNNKESSSDSSSSSKSESRISRCMFCGESLVLSCEEDAISHMRICPALQEQLNSEDQFTIPTMLRDKMQPNHGEK
eukprot:gene36741-49535_t